MFGYTNSSFVGRYDMLHEVLQLAEDARARSLDMEGLQAAAPTGLRHADQGHQEVLSLL